jgi:hypothetical protein
MQRFRWLGLLVGLSACGSNPVAPPTPAPPTPTPTPALVLTFTPQTASPIGAALAIFPGSRGQKEGMISLAVTAHNLNNVSKVRGEILWDPDVLDFDSWGEGDWFKQGGALVEWSFYDYAGKISLRLDRPSTLPGASGSGEIVLFRFKPHGTRRTGSTPLQWNNPELWESDYSDCRLDNVYGGTITIQ